MFYPKFMKVILLFFLLGNTLLVNGKEYDSAKIYWVNWNSTAQYFSEEDTRKDEYRMEITIMSTYQIKALGTWLDNYKKRENQSSHPVEKPFLVIDLCTLKDVCETYYSDGSFLTHKQTKKTYSVDKDFRNTFSLFLTNPFFDL